MRSVPFLLLGAMMTQLSSIVRPLVDDAPKQASEIGRSIHSNRLLLIRRYSEEKFQSLFGYNASYFLSEGMQLKGWYAPISPTSPFAQFWELISGILLLYSIFVTPLLIAFFTVESGFCGPAPTGSKYECNSHTVGKHVLII